MSTQINVDMLKNKQKIRRFSENFKLKIIAEISKGKQTKREICQLYNIGYTTINDWIKKYGREDLMNQLVTVHTMDEVSKIKALEKEIKQLKELLVKKDLNSLMLDSYLQVAAEELGFKNVDELKKKLDTKH